MTPKEDLYRRVVETIPEGIWIVDTQGRTIFCTKRMAEILGTDIESMADQTCFECVFPVDLPEAQRQFDLRLAGNRSPFDFRLRRRDGSAIWVSISCKPMHNDSGVVVGLLGLFTDITERKRVGEHFRLAVEAAPCAMVMVNHEHNIVLVNSQTEKLFGCERQELLGHSVDILVPESLRKIHTDFRGAFFTQPQARPMGAGRDLHAQRKDGTVFPVEIGLNPIETEEGTWVLSAIIDITERRRVEAMLRETEERFRNLADTAPVMIWISGPDKICTFVNQEWLTFTGSTMDQAVGDGWSAQVHPDDRDRLYTDYSSAFDARGRYQIEWRLRRADGEYRWVLDTGIPRFEPGGGFMGYIGSCIDITEVKRAQNEALALQKAESESRLARGVAHDFNNLLGGILATAELAQAACQEGSFPEEELRTIRTAAIRGSEIVGQLMDYSGEDSPALEPVDLSLLVAEMLEILKASISKSVTLETDLRQGLPAVAGNPAQIRQVVMNFVTNASQAIGKGAGVIRVATARVRVGQDARVTGAANLPPGDYLELEISDTGSGMTPEVQARIFDPFFTTKPSGRGLGLAAVQGIVRRHNGAINVVSSLGQGTRFEILLPCADQPATLPRPLRSVAPARRDPSVLDDAG